MASTRSGWVGLAGAVVGLAAGAAVEQPSAYRTIVLSGMQAPGFDPGVVITSLRVNETPQLNARGQILFRAEVSGGQEAIFSDAFGGGLRPIFVEGAQAPGLPIGVTIKQILEGSAFTDRGLLQCAVRLNTGAGIDSSNDDVLYLVSAADGAQPFIREGDPAIGFGPGVHHAGLPDVKFNARGTMLVEGRLAGLGFDASNDSVLYRVREGEDATVLLQEGQPVSGYTDGVFIPVVGPLMNRNDAVVANALFTAPGPAGSETTLLLDTRGSDEFVTVLQPGHSLLGYGTISIFDSFGPSAYLDDGRVLLAASHRLFAAFTTTMRAWMVTGQTGEFETLFSEGDPAPGLPPGITLANIGGVYHRGVDRIAFLTDLGGDVTDTTDEAIFRGTIDGGLELVVRTGDAAPGLPSGTTISRLRFFRFLYPGERGTVVFEAETRRNTTETDVLYAIDDEGEMTVLLKPPVVLDANNDPAVFEPIAVLSVLDVGDLNRRNEFPLVVRFGQGDAIYVFTVGTPPCSVADLAPPFDELTFSDVSVFLTAFAGADVSADLAEPVGQFTFADISAFLAAFSAGCP